MTSMTSTATTTTPPTVDGPLPAQIYGAFVALNGETWLLPNAAVADVLPFENVSLHAGSPDWLIGFVDWRGQRLPLVSADGLIGLPMPERMPRARVLVINTVTDAVGAGQYAVIGQGYPRLVTVNERAVQPDYSDALPTREHVASRVNVGNNHAIIPDLAGIEAEIANALVRVEAGSLDTQSVPNFLG